MTEHSPIHTDRFVLPFTTTPDRPADLPLPSYAKPGDAGLDLVAMEGAVLAPSSMTEMAEAFAIIGGIRDRALIRTGFCAEIPAGYVGLVCPRSGLAAKHGVVAVTGVIDSGFKGEIRVNLINHGVDPHAVAVGDRIAQLLILPVVSAELVRVEVLSESERGTSGFGSSGR